MNLLLVPFRWLLWTNKSMAGLEPTNGTIRERLCNCISVLGTAAGLFLVIAVSGLLQPPDSKSDFDTLMINIYGILMYTSTICFTMYIGIALTGLYPIIQSLRDDIAFDAFENFKNRWGGYELYMFNIGLQTMAFALLVLSAVLYSTWAVLTMIGIFFVVYWFVIKVSQQMFLALDPISAIHLGLSNDPNDIYRAELMSRFILNKVPNSILEEEKEYNEEIPEKELKGSTMPPTHTAKGVSDNVLHKLHSIVEEHVEPHHAHMHTGLFSQSTSTPSDASFALHRHPLPSLSVPLPSLVELFTAHSNKCGLPAHVGSTVHDHLVQSGCADTSMLVEYLDSNKNSQGIVHCNCWKYKEYVEKSFAAHRPFHSLPVHHPDHINVYGDLNTTNLTKELDDIIEEEVCYGQYFCSTKNFRNSDSNRSARKGFLKGSFSSSSNKSLSRRQVAPDEVLAPLLSASHASLGQPASKGPEHHVESHVQPHIGLQSYDDIHSENCVLRKGGCWQGALEHLLGKKVSPFHSFTIIKALKPYLK